MLRKCDLDSGRNIVTKVCFITFSDHKCLINIQYCYALANAVDTISFASSKISSRCSWSLKLSA